MKVALIGSSGFIAKHLMEEIKREKIDVLEINHSSLELMFPHNFDYSKLDEIDFVIFTAAISSPDKCAKDFELCWSINVDGTVYFIKKVLEKKCKVIFFSSDAVFGDIPGTIYNEESKMMPNTAYGKMKKAVEESFANEDNFKALRLSYVVSQDDKFTSYCLTCIKNRQIAEIFHPFYRNCTTLSDVIKIVFWLINNWKDATFKVLNICGKELVSRVRIADEINRFYNNELRYTVLKPSDDFYQNRPQITQIESLFLPNLPCFSDLSFSEKFLIEIGDRNEF